MTADILIVDDEADICALIKGVLEDEGYATRVCGSAGSALKAFNSSTPDLIILDIWLEGSDMDGMDLLDAFLERDPDLPVLMISGHGNIETAVAAIKKGAYDFIEKPFKSDRLLVLVARALETHKLKRENKELRLRTQGPSELIGTSPAMAQIHQAIERVAPTGSRVLITGEAGSGKEVAARQIHRLSRRRDNPFMAVNCANMRPDQLELELFGTENTPGILEKTHGGTLLLDEIADMPRETQGKILRALQDQTFERVGGSSLISVDVRIIASTNRDLHALIRDGKFREDLYYRLNVVPLRVPSLAERPEDIPLLATHFMQETAKSAGIALHSFSEDALAALQNAAWPGNVRQLRNVVEWVLIMKGDQPDRTIHADALPPDVLSGAPAVVHSEKSAEIMGLPLREAREVFEREYLRSQVTRFGGNISRTANFVGMERSALHRKLKSLGVPSANTNRDEEISVRKKQQG